MPDAVVELENVSFCRKEREILSDVSWRIESGAHWALLGANGSGKTTLLKILTGYAGRIRHISNDDFGDTSYRRDRSVGTECYAA
ncbi:MAG: ATP-binding protein [Planctomycetota bacterium]